MKLVKYDSNWADEMDVSGFRIMTDDDWEAYQEAFKNHFDAGEQYSHGIGTNEEIEYEDIKQFMSDFKVEEITTEEAAVIHKFFSKGSREDGEGFFPYRPDIY